MTLFGDFDPEDAYDAGDPVDVIARNLARRLERLAAELAARGGRPIDRDRTRVRQLVHDLDALAARLG